MLVCCCLLHTRSPNSNCDHNVCKKCIPDGPHSFIPDDDGNALSLLACACLRAAIRRPCVLLCCCPDAVVRCPMRALIHCADAVSPLAMQRADTLVTQLPDGQVKHARHPHPLKWQFGQYDTYTCT